MADSKLSILHHYQLIADPSDHTRKYLGGSLRHAMLDLLAQVHKSAGTKVHLCLYELDDPELMDHLKSTLSPCLFHQLCISHKTY